MLGTGWGARDWGEPWSALGWVQLMWDSDGWLSLSACPALGSRVWWGQAGQVLGNPSTLCSAAQAPQQSHPTPVGGFREVQEHWTASPGLALPNWWLLAGSCDHDCARSRTVVPCLFAATFPACNQTPRALRPPAWSLPGFCNLCLDPRGSARAPCRSPDCCWGRRSPNLEDESPHGSNSESWEELPTPEMPQKSLSSPCGEDGGLPDTAHGSPCP